MSELYKALIAFRAEAPVIAFDSVNPFFQSNFASLKAIHKIIDPLLAKHGLAVLQFPISQDGQVGCITKIIHESGESVEHCLTLPLTKQDPQGAGAAISYARRYGISGALCLITDTDNDGNELPDPAVANAGKRKPRDSKPAAMSKPHREKLKSAAADRLAELGDTKASIEELLDVVAGKLDYSTRIEMNDSDFDAAMVEIPSADPIPF